MPGRTPCWLLVPILLLSSCSAFRKTSAIDRLHPCKFADGPSDGYCGTLEVWENREAKKGRKIPLNIVVLPALKQNYAPDPLFFFAGGPGQGAASLAGQMEDPFHSLETDRDLVFVDQRGTGKSNPLECKPVKGEQEESEDEADDSFIDRLHTCLDSLKKKADLTQYTTPIAMDDIDDVRQFLGYQKIDVYGVSYGTRAALVYARRHAAHTRAVVLDSVAPTDMHLPLYMARDSQRSLDLLLGDCEKDSECNQRFPNLRDRLKMLLDRLSAHPQHIHYVDPRTGLEKDLNVKRLIVTSVLFASLYSPTTAALAPYLIDQADKGVYTGLLALGGGNDSMSETIAQGMNFSVVCSEDAPSIEPGDVVRESAGTFLGPEIAELRLKVCDFWPRAKMQPAYYENTPSDLPALILSGELDPVTPPVWGQQVASKWKNAKVVVVPGTGHGAWSSPCVIKLIGQFLNAGTGANLDTSCVQKVKRPPFFLGPSGPDPMAGAGK